MECRVAGFLFSVALVVRALPSNLGTSCDHQFISPSSQYDGYIVSPNYPAPYSPGFCFMWVYFGSPGTRISIRLLDIDIPNHSEPCSNDVLVIGPVCEHTYCGTIDSKVFDSYEAQLTTKQYWLVVVFNSTKVGTKGRGFKLHYQFSNIYGRPVSPPVSKWNTTTEAPLWSESFNSGSSCHFVLTAESGEITSNSTVLTCLEKTRQVTWLVYSPDPMKAGASYQLLFEKCYLPYPDTLAIYDNYTNTGQVLSYVRSPCPRYLMTPHHGFFIEYRRQALVTFPNFRIQFIIVKSTPTEVIQTSRSTVPTTEDFTHKLSDKCVFQIKDPTGTISSEDLVNAVHSTGYCSWLLHVQTQVGHQVRYTLTFERLQLSPNSILRVYDGANMSALELGVYSYMLPPFNITSSLNTVFIHYIPGIPFLVTDIFTLKYNAEVKCAPGYVQCGYGEFSCYIKEGRCDGIWHCPQHGGDERGCAEACLNDFSCDFRSSNCYKESDRCNGKGTCSTYTDEMGCSEDRCSSDKGLYLCRNGRCIYEKWKCDRMNDCFDNSDEEDCSAMSSPRLIVAAVIGSLLCALLLVIAVGCVCKVYHMRAHQLRGGPHHETPLSRQLAEMFYHRAPPPPYHEAILTSRPYDQAYLELLGQTERNLEALGTGIDQNVNSGPARENATRSNRQSNRRNRHSYRHYNQLHSLPSRPESTRQTEAENLPLLQEEFDNDGQSSAIHINCTELPPYSSGDPTVRVGSDSSDSEVSSDNETWQGDFENAGYTGGSGSPVRLDREPVIHLEVMPSATTRRSADHASPSPGLFLRNSGGNRNDRERNIDDADEDESDKDAETASTSLSVDSSRMVVVDEDNNKTEQQMNVIEEDSDSDCILDGNNVEDIDDSNSDTPCILADM